MSKQNLLTSFLLGLFGVSGPLAKFLATTYGLDSSTIELILSIGQLATPLVAGGAYWFLNTLASKIAAIKAMPPAQQAQVAAALPVEAKAADAARLKPSEAIQVAAALSVDAKVADMANLTPHEAVQIASALPDAANLAAVNAMPDVTKVVVRDNSTDGVGEAMQNSSLTKIVPQSQQEDV